jgi:hypothetical protein
MEFQYNGRKAYRKLPHSFFGGLMVDKGCTFRVDDVNNRMVEIEITTPSGKHHYRTCQAGDINRVLNQLIDDTFDTV